jgi:hypothetical protein
MADAKRDGNRVPALLGTSNADGVTPIPPYVDSATNRLLVNATIAGSISAGTEYTEGDTDTTITGTAAMWEDTSDTLRAISMAKPLPVQPGTSAAFPVTDNGGSLTVDGSVTVTQATGTNLHTVVDSGTITTITNVVHVDDNSSTISIDDGAGSITVDGTVAVSGTVTVDSELTTADLDTGAGTDTRAVVGLVGAKSGGGVLIPGDATAGLKVDLGADNDVTVTSGTITTITNVVHVDDNSSTISIDDGAGSITVDGTVAVTGVATAANQSTQITAEQAIQTAVETIDNFISGSRGLVTEDNSAAIKTSVELIDDAIKADDAAFTPATTKVMMAGFEYDDSSTDSVDEGDAGAARMSANRNQYMQVRDAAGNERGANVNASNQLSVSVDNTVTVASHAVTNAGTFAVQATVAAGATNIAKAEDVASADADVGVPAMAVRKGTPANTSGTDGDYEMLQMSAGRLWASATIDAALPAGANAIGKLAANSGVDIGDVDVTTVGTITPGTAATSLGKAEDAAHADGDVGVMSLAVRKNTAASTSGSDGDYQPLITNTTGHLWVDASGQTLTVGSHAVTNAGTFAVQESGTQVVADDAAFTPGTTKVVMSGFEADESSTDSVDEGDGGAARMTLDRKQIVTIQPHTAGGLSVFNGTSSDGGTALTSTAQVISAAAGQVYGWYIYNPNSSAQFVQFYNTAQASVTVGTTNPLFMLTIPATSAANVNFVQGIAFSNTGFSISATSTAGGNGAPSTALDAVIFFK